MKNVNRKLRKDYFKQIVTFFLVCCMFCNPAVLAEVVLDSQEPGSGITVTPLGTGTTQSMTAGNGGIGYFSDFDIDLGHTVICDQGGAQNSALFKVTSLDGTQIYGTFTTNGKLYLQDIRGIMIGANGEINASKFVASTLNINNTDWQKFVNGEINQLKFERGAEDPTGIVDNQGLINAARVYLIGSQVLNSGTIKAGENASDLVVMAAGNKVFLTHEDSKVLIKVPTDLVTPDPATNKVDIDAASTINADQVVLAAGDIFTAALNVGSLAATANRDITLEGTITTTGDITLVAGDDVDAQVLDAGGSVDISASDNTINLHEDVSADVDILLNNNTVADAGITLDAVEDVVLAAGKNLEGDGTLTVQADDDIILGAGSNPGDVSAVGDLTLDAGHSIEVADGGSITAGDDVFILGLLKALGDLTIEATEGGIDATDVFMSTDGSLLSLAQNDSLNMELAFADVINSENTNLSATSTGGSVTSAKADTWRTIAASANTFINLNDSDTGTGGDITTKALTTTTGDILITSNFGNVRAQGNITSGDDVKITAKDEGPDGSGDAIFLEGEIGEVFVPVHVEAVGDIWLNNNTWAAGGVSLDAGQDVRVGWQGDQDPWDPTDGYYAPKTLKGGGALTIEADRDITLGGDVESVGNLVLWADKDNGGDPGGDMTALGNVTSTEGNIDIYASDSTIILTGDKVEASGDVTLHNNTELHGGNQRIDAVNGKLITVDGVNVDKSTAGNADFGGGSGIEFGGNVTGSGLTASDTITFEDAVTANGTGPAEDQRFDAGLGSLWAKGTITKNAGVDLTLGGDEGIDLDGTVDVQTAAGSLTIEDDFTAAADLIATENVTLEGAGTLDGFVNQKIEAEKGKLYANDSIHKIEDGRLDMIGGFDGPLGSGDYSVKTKDVTVDKGALYITGKANVLLDGDLYSSGRMELTSNADGDLGADVGLLQHTSGTINSGDDVDIAALNSRILLNGGVAYDPANAAATTYVSAGGDILLYSSTSIAPDRNLDAGDDVALAANKRLLSDGSLTIEAGEDILLGIHDVTNHWSNQGVGSGGDVRVNGDLTLTAGDEVYAHGKLTTLDGSEG
ncbi:MAG: filamentous hemagglutinin N-terminal domain-containing protein, partial [Phycisphaerae bacterium]|nr:filamentous hemagglutinin N-terminal domain-containing protein [Phycisphaerae bacterium]NIR63010.1 filamentous hemagglutinin N-terminal domain-containing protein [candidate division Zixibacteria bacterium]NIP53806.1 filamentous hemagglutinin N-terminal domain-containing protein [Phycisphaerae bacterium]NIS50361.1 filamentous hemagglutinin N-terminal domain-containing protein [Phycisphaerae bacterium]NIU10199.1 filamentous hemagglutinin N-terminal domain-containing protein [Phycisphaerae bact